MFVHVRATMKPTHCAERQFLLSKGGKLFAAFVLLWTCAAQSCLAQISGNVSAVSDYRYRGVSLSEGKPEAQLSLGYDHPDGWYGGGLLSGAQLEGISTMQLVTYAGYTRLLLDGLSGEGGVSLTRFRQAGDYNYNEAFVGLTSENISARVYYSPSYFYQNARTVYAEVNGAYRLQEHWNVLAHIGVLRHLSGDSALNSALMSRYDFRLGLNAYIAEWNFQLALTGLQKQSSDYPQYEDLHPHTWLLSTAYSF